MTTIGRQSTNTGPVGKTPVPECGSWDDHREAMRLDSEARRTGWQVKTVITHRSSE